MSCLMLTTSFQRNSDIFSDAANTKHLHTGAEDEGKLWLCFLLELTLTLQQVDDIISELNLTKVQHTQVGAPGIQRGISGGERKRVSVSHPIQYNRTHL